MGHRTLFVCLLEFYSGTPVTTLIFLIHFFLSFFFLFNPISDFSGKSHVQQRRIFLPEFSVPSRGDDRTGRDSIGHLVSIHSEEENNFVTSYFMSSRKDEVNNFDRRNLTMFSL